MRKLSPKIKKLVDILNDGEFHSGNDLGEKLKISRAAVWKLIHRLKQYGLEIESLHGKGYRLTEPLSLLDEKKIKTSLDPSVCPQVEVYAEISSSQDHIKQKLKNDSNNSLCVAEIQTQARGRMGRSWFSKFGRNLCFSYLWHTEKDLSELGGLSLVVGLAIIEALKDSYIDLPVKLKWPNDIICHDKKLAGVLIEVFSEAHDRSRVLIGIGLNVNMTEGQEINQPWTSLQKEDNKSHDRNELLVQFIHKIAEYLKRFEKQGLKSFSELLRQYDYLRDKSISLLVGNKQLSGIVTGINAQGLLLLKMPDGEIKSFASGDVSIKK